MSIAKPYTSLSPIDILLVEDNAGDIELTMTAFDANRIANNIYVIEDGAEALEFLYQRGEHGSAPRPDIIILDINLPKIDGFEILKQVKEDENLKAIPIIMLTSSDAEKDIMNAYAHYASGYITKPLDVEKFFGIAKSIENFWFSVIRLPSRSLNSV